jgi:hypothetical protein
MLLISFWGVLKYVTPIILLLIVGCFLFWVSYVYARAALGFGNAEKATGWRVVFAITMLAAFIFGVAVIAYTCQLV